MKANDKKPTLEEILENNGFDFDQFEIDNEYSAKNLLKAMQEYADLYHKEKLREVIKQFSIMTDLVRLKYGNLDKDIYNEILKSEKMIDEYLKTKG